MRLRLKHAIIESGRSQRAVARTADIPESRFSGIVNGWLQAREKERGAIADALGQSVDVLFDRPHEDHTHAVEPQPVRTA